MYVYLPRLFQYTGSYKSLYRAPTLCFMLLDGAAIFRETTECISVVCSTNFKQNCLTKC